MKKKKPAAGRGNRPDAPPKPSAFEMVSHRKKFDILGRKVKGDKLNLSHSRSVAVEKRKKTLLEEYRNMGKVGGTIDRRFGENDPTLDPEAKALARMARIRSKELGRRSTFSIGDNDDGEVDEEVLTHMGRSLSEMDDFSDPSQDGSDEELDAEITRDFHFGGGLLSAKRRDEEEPEGADGDVGELPKKKTKKEVMEEIIAKSKAAKRMKAKEKEEDDDKLEALDDAFKSLSKAGALSSALRTNTGHIKRDARAGGRRGADGEDGDDDFDRLANELRKEARASAVTDRVRTAAEEEAAAAANLAQLEKQRQKRMRQRGSDDEDSDDGDSDDDLPKGGYAKRRAKRQREAEGDGGSKKKKDRKDEAGNGGGGDALDENYTLDDEVDEDGEGGSDEEDEDGGSGEDDSEEEEEEDDDGDPRNALRRALKKRIKAIAESGDFERGRRRLRRLGILKDGGDAGESDEDDDDGSGEEEEEDEDEDGEEGEDEEEEDEEGGSEEEEGEDEEEEEEDEEEEEEDEELAAAARRKSGAAAASATAAAGAKAKAAAKAAPRKSSAAAAAAAETDEEDIPFTFDAPSSLAQFESLVEGRSPEQLKLIVERIRVCNAVALAPDNRGKLQVFFNVLLSYFDMIAGRSPIPGAHVDALVPHLLGLAYDVPLFAATAARARLERAQKALAAGLAEGKPRWLQARSFLLLRLLRLMFPTTDFRHPVLTPAALLLGQYLAYCPVSCRRDTALASMAAALALDMAADGNRLVPEAISMLTALVHSAGGATKEEALQGLPVNLRSQLTQKGLWAPPAPPAGAPAEASAGGGKKPKGAAAAAAGGKKKAGGPQRPQLVLLRMSKVLETPQEDPFFETEAFRLSCLHASVVALKAAAAASNRLPAAEALLAPAAAAASRLLDDPARAQSLPSETLEALRELAAACAGARAFVHPPLRLYARKREAIRSFTPRFEEDGYQKGRDYDVDRERSEKRRLKREVQQEKKGAARELRKDNRFLAEERAKAVAKRDEERTAAQKSALAFLQNFEADFKSGGQGGAVKGLQKKERGPPKKRKGPK